MATATSPRQRGPRQARSWLAGVDVRLTLEGADEQRLRDEVCRPARRDLVVATLERGEIAYHKAELERRRLELTAQAAGVVWPITEKDMSEIFVAPVLDTWLVLRAPSFSSTTRLLDYAITRSWNRLPRPPASAMRAETPPSALLGPKMGRSPVPQPNSRPQGRRHPGVHPCAETGGFSTLAV
jgi:hypothetical protein